jgi:predicted Zn-dependent protease
MPRFQKYEQKIRKYKEKLKKFVMKIGIFYSEDFELVDDSLKKLILPCHLGVLFYGEINDKLFTQIAHSLNEVYDSFFFEIRNLGQFNFPKELYSKGVKTEHKELRKTNDKLSMHPTNKFYQVLIDKRRKENLGLIILLTDLPIYSSSDDNILFLFGETHLKHRCSIVSTLKLKEQFYYRQKNESLFNERIIKEFCHEIGHILLGSDHCEENSCVMKFSNNIEEIDKKSYELCQRCKIKLSEIRHDFNF